jgi:hypothetical protein
LELHDDVLRGIHELGWQGDGLIWDVLPILAATPTVSPLPGPGGPAAAVAAAATPAAAAAVVVAALGAQQCRHGAAGLPRAAAAAAGAAISAFRTLHWLPPLCL